MTQAEPKLQSPLALGAQPVAHRQGAALTGYLMLLGSVVCNASRYHMDKQAMRLGCTPAILVGISGVVAALGFVVCGIVWRSAGWRAAALDELTVGRAWATLRSCGGLVLFASVIGAAGALLGNYCNRAHGAELTSFLANMTVIFVVLGGLLKGERFTLAEAMAVVVIILGAFLFSYKGGGAFHWGALALMAASCLFTAGKQLSVNRASIGRSLVCVMALVSISSGITSFIIAPIRHEWAAPPLASMAWVVLGSIVGSMVGMMLLYDGCLRVGVSRGAPVDALRPLGVLLIGLALVHFNLVPMSIELGAPQLIGGVLVLGGSALLANLSKRGHKSAAGEEVA